LNSASSYSAIVFDLGGVLIELTGVPRMLEWMGDEITADELWRRWLASESVRGFECGRISAEQFAREMRAEFGIPVSSEQFLAEFALWPKAAYEGATELLRKLADHYVVACLSNTNALHWARIDDEMGLLPHFNHHFASHLVGMLKPDREVFEHMATELEYPPERILFLDDNQVNVDGARAAGISAYKVVGLEGAIAKLEELGVI
jgi:putative hydrolase of the HAD superfamily